jgi:hypothetical protein
MNFENEKEEEEKTTEDDDFFDFEAIDPHIDGDYQREMRMNKF